MRSAMDDRKADASRIGLFSYPLHLHRYGRLVSLSAFFSAALHESRRRRKEKNPTNNHPNTDKRNHVSPRNPDSGALNRI